jgi:hypothetical protein
LILKHNYHDFECWSKTIKRFGQGVGLVQLQRTANADDNLKIIIENALKNLRAEFPKQELILM